MFTKKDKKTEEQKLDVKANLQYKCYDLSYSYFWIRVQDRGQG
jgi:hypothetical protein